MLTSGFNRLTVPVETTPEGHQVQPSEWGLVDTDHAKDLIDSGHIVLFEMPAGQNRNINPTITMVNQEADRLNKEKEKEQDDQPTDQQEEAGASAQAAAATSKTKKTQQQGK